MTFDSNTVQEGSYRALPRILRRKKKLGIFSYLLQDDGLVKILPQKESSRLEEVCKLMTSCRKNDDEDYTEEKGVSL